MRLNEHEFRLMNNRVKEFLQERIEFPILQLMGLRERNRDILEIGCGSGYGAVLLSRLEPRNYTGIDLMPEQLELARRRDLRGATFSLMDASNLSTFGDASRDVVTVFRIFHHMPAWRRSLREVHRVLRPGGRLFVVEPLRIVTLLGIWTIYDHPREALFTGGQFATELKAAGFVIRRRLSLFGMNFFHAVKPGAARWM